jgi:hypothetical protein
MLADMHCTWGAGGCGVTVGGARDRCPAPVVDRVRAAGGLDDADRGGCSLPNCTAWPTPTNALASVVTEKVLGHRYLPELGYLFGLAPSGRR